MWTRIVMLSTCLKMIVGVANAQQVSVSDLLDRYEANQAEMGRFSAESISTRQVTTPLSSTFEREQTSFHSDGERVHWRCYQWGGLNARDEATPLENAVSRAFLWDGKTAYEYRKERDINGKLFVHSNDRLKTGMVGVGYDGSPLMGLLKGDTVPVGSILRQAKTLSVRPEREQVAGASCFVLDAVTEHGAYTVWLDPDHGYHIARASVHKKTGDLAWGRPLGWVDDGSQLPPPNARGSQSSPESISFVLQNVRFDRIGGVWVPMEADYETTIRRGDQVSVSKCHHQRTQCKLNPDFDATHAFLPDIPDGTQAFVLDAPGIRYEWQKGKPVGVVSEEYLADLDRSIAASGKEAAPSSEAVAKPSPETVREPEKTTSSPRVVADKAGDTGSDQRTRSRCSVVGMTVAAGLVIALGLGVYVRRARKA